MKKNKYFLVFIGIFIFAFIFPFFNTIDMDLIWNYGFSYNFAKGMVMYKDYAMVITPFFPLINGFLMYLFGTNMITFYIVNAFMITGIMYLVYLINKKLMIPMFIVIIFFANPNYNMLCVLFVLLLIYLEKEKKNDYLIGFILGLTFLTKISIGAFLCIPSLFTKDLSKILKRIVGFIIPNLIIVIWFYFNKSLNNYIDYAFLGLFDFANDNTGGFSIYMLFSFITIFILIIKYIRKKDIKILYLICFQIMNYPLFNISHFAFSFIPVLFYFMGEIKLINISLFQKLFKALLIIPIIALVFKGINNNLEKSSYFDSRMIQKKVNDDLKLLDNELQKDIYIDKEIYFITANAYMYKLAYNIKINEFDLLMKGNMGYKGTSKMINKIKSIQKGSIFVIELEKQMSQFPEEILNFIIKNNYQIKILNNKYAIYTN